MTSAGKWLLIAAIGIAALFAARQLTAPWFQPPDTFTSCIDGQLQRIQPSQPNFAECIERNAKLFLEKDYAESKDLAKTFLTLLSAILVASITFSEKVVDIHSAKRTPLTGMLLCWFLLLVAIVLTGSGLASMALGAGYAAYYAGAAANYRHLESHAVLLFVGGCFSFGFAMLALIVSGAVSLADKRRNALAAPPQTGKPKSDELEPPVEAEVEGDNRGEGATDEHTSPV